MGVLQDIQQRDDNLYRVIFMADPIPSAIRQAGYGGTNRYEHLMDMANSDLVINTTQKMDMISKQLYIQSRLFDDVVEMCKNHDEMLRRIPAIQPVSNKDLRKTASGYGTRIDPIYGTSKFHEGMDFRPQGTDVYATGDGTVVQMGWQSGYGNRIVIDHGSVIRRCMHTCAISGRSWARKWYVVRSLAGRQYGQEYWSALALRSTRQGKSCESRQLLLHGSQCRGL